MDKTHQNKDSDARKDRAAIAGWLEEQRGRPQYRAAPHVSRALGKIMRPLSKKHSGGTSGLSENWEIIIGARMARISKPVRFLGGRDGRTLLISAPGPAGALIMASSTQIVQKVNAVLGPEYIRHIKVIQTRMEVPKTAAKPMRGLNAEQTQALQSGLEHVKNPALKKALEQLGRNVHTRPKP